MMLEETFGDYSEGSWWLKQNQAVYRWSFFFFKLKQERKDTYLQYFRTSMSSSFYTPVKAFSTTSWCPLMWIYIYKALHKITADASEIGTMTNRSTTHHVKFADGWTEQMKLHTSFWINILPSPHWKLSHCALCAFSHACENLQGSPFACVCWVLCSLTCSLIAWYPSNEHAFTYLNI